MKEMVTITVPKHEEKHYTDGLSNTEVKSRLRALADTIDSRGWAVKGSAVSLGVPVSSAVVSSDRLYQPAVAVQENIAPDIKTSDDIYDETSSPTAQHFDQMIQESEQKHRQQIVSQLSQPPQPDNSQQPSSQPGQQNDYWFMRQPTPPSQPGTATFGATPVVMPGQQTQAQPVQGNELSKQEEQKILDKIHENQNKPNPMNSHLKTIQPLSAQKGQPKQNGSASPAPKKAESTNQEATQTTDKSSGQQPVNADILTYANNNDLSVETIARQANKNKGDSSDDEVVVSLH